jgi:predicted SAM-dependent methyltransferase
LKLDIGCGLNPRIPLHEWIHLDKHPGPHIEIVGDFGVIPLPDGEVEQIHLGDVIEHVEMWRQAEVLREWNRIMKVGGVIGGTTPNLDSVAQRYARGDVSLDEALIPNIYGWNDRPTEHHFTIYTKVSLTEMFAQYGFEVTDYSRSPGPVEEPWWLVFSGRKVAG